MYVSLRGRVILLSYILNVIHIFFLSFMKIPFKACNKIMMIQQRFLRGGVKGASKIAWVRLVVVYKPKKLRGLGVHDPRLVKFPSLVSGGGS